MCFALCVGWFTVDFGVCGSFTVGSWLLFWCLLLSDRGFAVGVVLGCYVCCWVCSFRFIVFDLFVCLIVLVVTVVVIVLIVCGCCVADFVCCVVVYCLVWLLACC